MIKPIVFPLPGEGRVSYGDRLLWNQLALQLNNQTDLMLSEDEFVRIVKAYYPEAVEENVRQYRNYFNSRHESMGFRGQEAPTHVRFA